MRQALTLALQSYEGAMVIVSHDRYLLRATTDDLYLVHDRKVEPFDGDLQDYHKWLTEQQRNERRELQASKPETSKDNSAASRKEQKRLEAEFRKQTAPMRKQIEKLDKQMETLSATLADAEAQLSDVTIYEAEHKARLNEQLKRQADAKSSLEDVEMEWMELQEQLEAMEAEFLNQ